MKKLLVTTLYLASTQCFAGNSISVSQIDERLLMNPPSAGKSEQVIIYSNVRNKTIDLAMDNQFNRIENMMFINTVVETEIGELSYAEDECD